MTITNRSIKDTFRTQSYKVGTVHCKWGEALKQFQDCKAAEYQGEYSKEFAYFHKEFGPCLSSKNAGKVVRWNRNSKLQENQPSTLKL